MMTERDISDLQGMIMDYCSEPCTEKEIIDHMAGVGENPEVIRNLICKMTAERLLAFAPGSLARKLTTTAHAKAMAAGSEEEGEE